MSRSFVFDARRSFLRGSLAAVIFTSAPLGTGTAAPAAQRAAPNPAPPRVDPTEVPSSDPELRGVWIPNTDCDVLLSLEGIDEAIGFLADHGFNAVFPVVWSKGRTCYPSEVAKKALGVGIDPRYGDRDPLAEIVAAAHARGMAVVAWFEYGFAAAYQDKTPDLFRRKPGWKSTGGDGKLVEKNGFRWMDPLDPEVQGFLRELFLEVATGYAVDGVQGDDRFPAMPVQAGYDHVARFRKDTGAARPGDDRDEAWMRWRADRLNEYLASVQADLLAGRPDLVISLSPSPPGFGYREYLQDSPAWVRDGRCDWIHPQVYRRDLAAYRGLMAEAMAAYGAFPGLYPGILVKSGGYVIDAEHLLGAIAWNRVNGIRGEVLFHYAGLRENGDALARALRDGPYRTDVPWPRPARDARAGAPERDGGAH